VASEHVSREVEGDKKEKGKKKELVRKAREKDLVERLKYIKNKFKVHKT